VRAKTQRLAEIVAILAVALATGCGDGRDQASDREQIRQVVADMQRDIAADKPRRACEAFSREVRRQIGMAGHGTPSGCALDLRETLDLIRLSIRDARPAVDAVELDGDRAIATLAGANRTAMRVPFAHEDGRWRIANLFGASTLPPKTVAARPDTPPELPTTSAAATPATSGAAVTVAGSARPCGRVRRDGAHGVAGGCRGDVVGGAADFVVRTPLGSFPLSAEGCAPLGGLRIASDGRIWIDEMALRMMPSQHLCADTVPCTTSKGEIVPWAGRLRMAAGGQLVGELEMCVATCVGRYRGTAKVEASTSPRGMRLRFDSSPLESGGLIVHGSWRVAGLGSVKIRRT